MRVDSLLNERPLVRSGSPVSPSRTFASAFVASAHSEATALRHPGFAGCLGRLGDTGDPDLGRPAREACVPADPWPQAWSLRNTPSTTKDVDCILKPSGFGQAASLPPLVNRQAVLRGLVTPRHAAGEARAACHPPFAPWPPTRVGSGLRHAAGEARAACHPGRPASTSIRADRATTPQRPHALGRPEGGRPGGGPASPAGPGMARRALKNQARRALKPHGRQRCGRGRSRAALGLPGGSGPRGADSGCERDSQRVD
jgi:hypothetical protein